MLDTGVFFSRRLVGGSAFKTKNFCRVLELTQEVSRPRLCVRNLPRLFSFFVSCNQPFQAFLSFQFPIPIPRPHLTVSGQFMDVACGDTVYIVDRTLYHVVGVVLSTKSFMIHPAFDRRRGSFFVGFSALLAPPKPVSELAVNTDAIQDCKSVPLCCPLIYQMSWTSALSQLHL